MHIRQQVLNALRGSRGMTAKQLSVLLSRPAPSIRRTISELREIGWHVNYDYEMGDYWLSPREIN